VAAKKGSTPQRPPPPRPPRKSVTDVDPAWLEDLAEDEKPPSKRGRKTPPPRRPSSTIPVEAGWLIPPLPEEVKTQAKVPKLSHPPVKITTKPKGQLPPPLPRTDDEDDGGK
jgi:hypothetical protein